MIIKLFVSKCSLLSYSICLRACKICVVFEVELNVKYGRALTHNRLESNISTKHVPTTTLDCHLLWQKLTTMLEHLVISLWMALFTHKESNLFAHTSLYSQLWTIIYPNQSIYITQHHYFQNTPTYIGCFTFFETKWSGTNQRLQIIEEWKFIKKQKDNILGSATI